MPNLPHVAQQRISTDGLSQAPGLLALNAAQSSLASGWLGAHPEDGIKGPGIGIGLGIGIGPGPA